jgi:hypothetical protein
VIIRRLFLCALYCSRLSLADGVEATAASAPLPEPAAPYLKFFPPPEPPPPPSPSQPASPQPTRYKWGVKPATPPPPPSDNRIRWGPLLSQSAFFLSLQHAVRLATEEGTREGLKGPFFRGYADAVTNMHGWDDGDPFYVNYIGHPMQGAVASYLWLANDGTYQYAQFGMNRTYWRSRLRTLPFSYLYSVQFEIGPFSEATIGKVQSKYPAQGFVDHTMTTLLGLAWMVGEDALDRFLVIPLEKRWDSPVGRIMLRGWLNPARSWTNMMRLKVPWYRDTRAGVFEPYREYSFKPNYDAPPEDPALRPWQQVAPFELSANAYALQLRSAGESYPCVGGGGGQLAFNARQSGWSWIGEVNGCKLYNLGANRSGDGLTFLTGPRYTWRSSSRLMPFVQLLAGGHKFTLETEDPVAYARLVKEYGTTQLPNEVYEQWHIKQDNAGLAGSIGGGLDLGVNRYLTIRLANLDYTYVNLNRPLDTIQFRHGLRYNFGLVLRMGHW